MVGICVLGSGYVGLTAGACLCSLGHAVICCDIDSERILSLREGCVPIFEPHLSDLVIGGLESGNLRFSDDLAGSVSGVGVIIVAVGTPSDAVGKVDMSFMDSASLLLLEHADIGATVIIKSTVPAGTSIWLSERLRDKSISVVSNPEFLREGHAVEDFMNPDRIVVGLVDSGSESVMREVYGDLAERFPFIVTGATSAELAKYASNSMIAVRLSFINEVADLCSASGANWGEVQEVMGLDKRIGGAYLQAGPGYGGSCLPKDTRALSYSADGFGVGVATLKGAVISNESRKRSLLSRVIGHGDIVGKRVAMLGLAFKADSDDVRESSAIGLAIELLDMGVDLVMHDPQAMENSARVLSGGEFADSAESALRGADIVLIMTEWDEYRDLSAAVFKNGMRGDVVIDFRNIYVSGLMAEAGLRYYSLESHVEKG